MATRSPSPNPTRAANPNPKTPESSNSSIRKSGNSNFSKPSISSDLPQRNSGSKAGTVLPCMRSSFEQKENERDPNCLQPARARSPATPSLKGTKNFMAPTISASSKVTSASPRKKILTERNEVVRSSMGSVSDSLEFLAPEEVLPKSEMGFGALPLLDASKASRVSSEGVEKIKMKSEMGFCSEEISCTHQELKNVDHKIKKNHSPDVPSFSPSQSIASLDDPSLPPYDPKTNYLSPRPRFLHYKPSARVEHHLNKEGNLFNLGDGQRLEESFSSHSCEDTVEHINNEAESFYLQKDSEEDASSAEIEVQEVKDETRVPQSKPNRNHIKSCPFNRSKFAPLLLVLVIACLFVPLTDSPIVSSSLMLKDRSFEKPYSPTLRVFNNDLGDYLAEIVAVANSNLEGLASKFRHWSAFYTIPGSLPKAEVGFFHLENLTVSAVVDQAIYYSRSETKTIQDESCVGIEAEQAIKENVEEEESSPGSERKIEMEVLEDVNENGDSHAEGETEKKFDMEVLECMKAESTVECEMEKMIAEDGVENVEEEESSPGTEMKIEMEVLEDVNENGDSPAEDETGKKIEMEVSEYMKAESTVEYEMKKKIVEDGLEDGNQEESHPPGHELQQDIGDEVGKEFDYLLTEPKTVENEEHRQGSIDLNPLTQIQPACSGEGHQISHGPEIYEYKIVRQEEKLSKQTVLGISVVVLALAATLVFLHLKQKQPSIATHEKLPPKNVSPSWGSYTHARRFLDQNLQVEVEMMGDSALSEMSSSLQNSSSCGLQRTERVKEDEILSHERRLRRDSAASSTSYGSFTTYEKLSAKMGCRDEDAVTPVRRSSRIRNQVTSP